MNKKGFTLVELLAVIIILGIIALIAVPIVNNVIQDSQKGAAEASALAYIQAINDQNTLYKLDSNKYTEITSDSVENINANIKGDGPTSGTVTITNGKVTEAEFCITGYNVTYNGKKVTIGSKCDSPTVVLNGPTLVAPEEGDTHKGIVYLNPTDTSVGCAESNSQIGDAEANESGCMKFYIFDDSGDVYKMILDHSTSTNIAWVSQSDYIADGGTSTEWNNNKNVRGPITALKQLAVDTEGWLGNPRLISADEIAHLSGADTAIYWDSSKTYSSSYNPGFVSNYYLSGNGSGWKNRTVNSTNKSKYAWLYDYTSGCEQFGCNVENSLTTSYWTSSAVIGKDTKNNDVWIMQRGENITSIPAHSNSGGVSIRPVIELPKSLFE